MPASSTWPHIAPTRARAIGLVSAVFLFFFAIYVLTSSSDIFSTGDTTIRMEIAEDLIYQHTIQLVDWKLEYPKHLKKEFFDPRVSIGRGGKTYSTYLPGQPLAIIPFDILGSQVAGHEHWVFGPTVAWFDRFVGPLFGALEVTVFFMFAVRLGFGRWRSLLLTAIFAFATAVWPDEQSVLEHGEVAFFLLLGSYFAFRYREQGRPWPYLLLAGAAVGGAMDTRYQDAAIGVVGIGLYLFLPGSRDPRWWQRIRADVFFGLGVLPFILVDGLLSWARFGSPLASGHHETVFGYPPWLGAAGLVVSPGKGILWYCPTIFLLAIAGPLFARRFPALAVSFAAIVAGFIFLYANVQYWHGDPAWGPRYIFPTVPFLTLPLGELFRIRTRLAPLAWLLTALVVGAGLTIQVSAVAVNPWRSWYRVISYEENQGFKWQWIAARYRYFWNIHESPLLFQLHGLYQMTYDTVNHSNKYEIVPPDEDPILDKMTTDYAINQWGFWWASPELYWWMGDSKVLMMVIVLLSAAGASAAYIIGETSGAFAEQPAAAKPVQDFPEAA